MELCSGGNTEAAWFVSPVEPNPELEVDLCEGRRHPCPVRVVCSSLSCCRVHRSRAPRFADANAGTTGCPHWAQVMLCNDALQQMICSYVPTTILLSDLSTAPDHDDSDRPEKLADPRRPVCGGGILWRQRRDGFPGNRDAAAGRRVGQPPDLRRQTAASRMHWQPPAFWVL